jgi:8-hydroxy-5-deazaflavin:NADPH oxidoreductase
MSDKKIGIIGAGRLGTAVAKLAIRAGYQVDIANSGDAKVLDLTLRVLLPEATAKPIHQLISTNNLILLAIPFGRYAQFSHDAFSDKLLIDATNYWAPTEGVIQAFVESKLSSSEFLQNYFVNAKIVKTLNHIAYSELWPDSALNTKDKRRAVALATDNEEARAVATQLVQDLGFDVVDFGAIKNGKHFQPDTKLFNVRYDKAAMKKVATLFLSY